MRKFVASALVATTVLLGCGDDDDEIVSVDAWQASIVGLGDQNLRGESTVTQTTGGDEFTATIEVRDDIPGSVRPWHVHFGRCGSGGAIVGEDEDYPRLTIDENGSATARVNIEETLDRTERYHVNVHLSDNQQDIIIACGDLTLIEPGLDAGVTSDAAADTDAAVGADATVESDAGVAPDAAIGADATVGIDAGVGS